MSKLKLWWHPKCFRYFKSGTYFGGIVSTNIMLIENVSVKLTKLYGDWYSILENKTNEVIENVGCSGNRIKVSVGTKGVPVLRDWWIEGPEGYESFVVYWFSWLRIMGPLLSRCFYLFFLGYGLWVPCWAAVFIDLGLWVPCWAGMFIYFS